MSRLLRFNDWSIRTKLLARMAGELQRLVSEFRVEDSRDYAPAPAAASLKPRAPQRVRRAREVAGSNR